MAVPLWLPHTSWGLAWVVPATVCVLPKLCRPSMVVCVFLILFQILSASSLSVVSMAMTCRQKKDTLVFC